ncbi:MAG: enoyl-CoA hydratase/isomerase family protein [Planctomycetes bacterium]|jgi:cyclohexa-1,5-dienecarbonyl-CoA hydratase|nr:enoyl-CoA hydratase/isomerase family protein [Planctomycetota bacterium]MCL4729782.1 enoyl-CoA hydratase/isomerase family protein [Planctomycetota bacterium]
MPFVRAQPDHSGKLLRLILNRPRGNVFSGELMAELESALAQAPSSPTLRLVTLEAEGDHFSFGAAVEEHTRAQVVPMLQRLNRLIKAVAACPVPVAALVQGKCLGGAFEVVLAAHFVFAAENARFGVPEIRLGVFPPAACALLARKVGQASAERWILAGEEISADEAHRVGLAHRVFPADSLRRGVDEWFAVSLGQYSASSLRHAVAAARAPFLAGLDDALESATHAYVKNLVPTHDAEEGIQAFVQRRRPQWRDA